MNYELIKRLLCMALLLLAAVPAMRAEDFSAKEVVLEHIKDSHEWHITDLGEGRDKPLIYVSCGTADFLYGMHKPFISALRKNGWEVKHFEKKDAVHEWGFWDEQIKAFIDLIFAD